MVAPTRIASSVSHRDFRLVVVSNGNVRCESAAGQVLRVISEPTAAAMAYGLQSKANDQLILVRLLARCA
jgi:hypothetical protein